MAASITDQLLAAIYTSVFLNKSSDYIEADAVPAIVRAGLPVASVEPLLRALGASNLAAAEKVPGVTPEILQAAVVQLTDAYSRTFKIGMSHLPDQDAELANTYV